MPARIVVVHDDPQFIEMSVSALLGAGHDIRAFSSSMATIDVLEAPERLELLVTRVAFPQGQPNGVSLARMARVKRPGVKILFVARPENREHTKGLGEFLAMPVTETELAAAVERILAGSATESSRPSSNN